MVTGFGVMALIALVLLATYKPPVDTTTKIITAPVTIWGTLDSSIFQERILKLGESNQAYRLISYTQKDPSTFDSDVLNALADGEGPDILLLPHEKLVEYRSRIQPISLKQIPEPDFRSRYLDGAEIFMFQDGIYGVPFAVDPLVMYWNRDILASYDYLSAPTTWEQLVNEMVPRLVSRDFNRTILRSPLAFGEYRNVTNAFPVISLLLLQQGSLMVTEGRDVGSYQLRLNETKDGNTNAFENVVTFYTNFANPSNPLYSWNRTKRNDRQEFIAEDLVFYFGKGSEVRGIALQNPNLNFDMSEVPQGATASVRRTYATFYGFAILKASQNKNGAYYAIDALTTPTEVKAITDDLGLAPALRAVIGAGNNEKYGRIIYSASGVARGWWSPKEALTESAFTTMVEDVLANRTRPGNAAGEATSRLREAY